MERKKVQKRLWLEPETSAKIEYYAALLGVGKGEIIKKAMELFEQAIEKARGNKNEGILKW